MIGAAFFVAAATAQAASPPTAAARVAQVFEQVCVDGSSRFAAGEIQAVSAGDIPTEARRLAMIVLWFEHRESGTPSEREMPAHVYRLSGKDEAYLAVPDEQPTNQIQASCFVITEDGDYEELAGLASAIAGTPPADLRRSNAMVSFPLGDHRLFVARGLPNRWTMIAVLPLQITLSPEASK